MKNQLVQQVKTYYKEKLEEILAQEHVNFQAAKKDVVEAEGRMVTRYDSTKTEVAWLANSRLAEIKTLEKEIERVFATGKVNLGDCVTVDVPMPSGEIVRTEYVLGDIGEDMQIFGEIKGITTPEAQALLGRIQEDIVEVENANGGSSSMQILAVQPRERQRVVLVNTVVKVEDEEFGDEYYFITEGRGGIILELEDGMEVMVVNVKTPLALALLGKKVGDQVSMNFSGEHICHLQVKEIFFN